MHANHILEVAVFMVRFLEVCKKYQYVCTNILEKYYLRKASTQKVHKVSIKDTFSHKIDTIFDTRCSYDEGSTMHSQTCSCTKCVPSHHAHACR
jgi:hypothetical protein